MARSNEPVFWSLFSAGGVVAALFGPVLIFLLGLAQATGWFGARDALAYERLQGLVARAPVKIGLFLVIALPLFHWAHRFRFTLADLGFRSFRKPLALVCYGTAVVVSLSAALVLWRL